MAKGKSKVRGVNQVVASLTTRTNRQIAFAKEVLAESGQIIKTNTQKNVPIDTGNAADSVEVISQQGGLVVQVVAGGPKAPYFPYLEFGTGAFVEIPEGWGVIAEKYRGAGIKEVNLPARPSLIPAFNQEARALRAKLRKAVKDANK